MNRIIFMGTPDFAAHILERLIAEKINIIAVITQPDRPFGRKKELKASEVKMVALAHQLLILQPEKIGDAFAEISELKPDLIITAAYGQFVPTKILELPRCGCVNVHGSLLPKYRGGAPIHQAIIDGETQTGVTLIEMVKKMDAGDMIAKAALPIEINDTTRIIYDKLKVLGADLLLENLDKILEQSYQGEPQDETQVTFSPNITKEQEKIEWNLTAIQVHNQVRGLFDWPVAYAFFEGKRMKILKTRLTNMSDTTQPSGTIVAEDETSFYIQTVSGIIQVLEIQPEGKKKMLVSDYLRSTSVLNKRFSWKGLWNMIK
ncbi:MAG: methionyl-tRNA formyltransferase [Mycoplasmatales bacterium]